MKPSSVALPLALALMAAPAAFAPAAFAPAAFAQAPGAADLATPEARASYAIGRNIGDTLLDDGVPLDEAAFLRGVRDALTKAKPALTDEEADAALDQIQGEILARRRERAAVNTQAGEAFLKANAKKSGVVTTTSGLQYQVLNAGTGPKPKATDTVRTNYRGTLLDGTEFDSSAAHGGPAEFPVNGVIPGWTEALQLMPVGSKWRLFVPPALAYGVRGAGEDIGPNATLVFEVELLGVE